MFPLFTVLAPKKDTATYIAILKKIRELHPEFKPARCHLDYEDAERLATASNHWREGVAGNVAAARACLELATPAEGVCWMKTSY